ncbi:hypothetical protein ACIQ1D_19645 [Lysinibacillus xylanilyticus]|uniref:hypothetical protein n=1 Tax=Lysinibacillus xylanilyticus TaxID=582475 RepID=UPI00382D18A2
MLDKKTFKEEKEQILKKGYSYRLDLQGKTTQEFADALLILTNHKCSNPNSGIVEVKTVEGTNLLIVDSLNGDDLDEYKKFTDNVTVEEIQVVNIFLEWLQEDGMIKSVFNTAVKVHGY